MEMLLVLLANKLEFRKQIMTETYVDSFTPSKKIDPFF